MLCRKWSVIFEDYLLHKPPVCAGLTVANVNVNRQPMLLSFNYQSFSPIFNNHARDGECVHWFTARKSVQHAPGMEKWEKTTSY